MSQSILLFNRFNRLLFITFIFISAMIVARMIYTGTFRHLFLGWNIFLAWIPYVISIYLRQYQFKQLWKQVVLFCSWLLFFPNALYIVTDLVHLQENGTAPLWFDVVLLFTASLLGLLMAFASLNNVARYLRHKYGRSKTEKLIPVLLFLGSYGVYLGRFERWNSWDILHNPLELANDIFLSVLFPGDHIRTWAVTIVLTILFYILYGFTRFVSLQPNKNAP